VIRVCTGCGLVLSHTSIVWLHELAAWDGDLVPKSVAGNLLDSGSGSDDDPEQGRWSHPSALVAKAVYHLDKVFSGMGGSSRRFMMLSQDVVN